MNDKYQSCGNCDWYGPEHALDRVVKFDRCEFWGRPVKREYVEVCCPECGRDDSLNDAGHPCIRCEAAPMNEETEYCDACEKIVQAEGA
jgi:hypothetical protein